MARRRECETKAGSSNVGWQSTVRLPLGDEMVLMREPQSTVRLKLERAKDARKK